ncbi:MAG: alpha-galactosidase [Eubacterium sp.]|nr:alpha-galactosidase [Eubacterium sp.]
MIIDGKKYFILNTNKTSYVIRIKDTGHLEHLYYGKKIRVTESLGGLEEIQVFPIGNNNSYNGDNFCLTLNNLCLETSFEGKTDNREAMIVTENSEGIRTSDYVFESYSIDNKKETLKGLPSSYAGEEEVDHLQIVLYERYDKLRLFLDYYTFDKANVITRTARLVNEGESPVNIEQFYSAQLDLPDFGYVMNTFNGAWAREMSRKDVPLLVGRHVNSSFTGTSSNNANPFFMISTPYTTEDSGIAYGMNLIYSGNHAESAEVNEFGRTRILWGINPRAFRWRLEAGEEFETPEAVMTFTDKGFNDMSTNMHRFVRNHVVRPEWAKKDRPVLLNSWEAAYFDINERKLLRLAKAGRDVGIELFVMDDGWFGKRDDDSSSLGDWKPDRKKLPNGVKGICDKVNQLGMAFGIWVEPEMVNCDSDLYRVHPDWAIQIPGRAHSEGRNQRMLDLGRTEVQDYIIESMTDVFKSANIEYVKWDMNRTLTDIYSEALAGDESTGHRQGELTHRYMLGLYRCMKELTEKFPEILFEGCSAGGNRFDLGILSYFPQIWGSDDTDALVRAEIQNGYSYGYPQSCWGAHVSGVPNHQTLRVTPLETRFDMASFGSLGYECNLCDMSRDELAMIKEQIQTYKKYRKVFQHGSMKRGRSFTGSTMYAGINSQAACFGGASGSVLTRTDSNVTEWTVVSEDKKQAVGCIIQKNVVPNMAYQCYRPVGLDGNKLYHFTNREIKVNIKEFGDLVNSVSPIHIKNGSLTQDFISKFYKLNGDKEEFEAYGSAMMYAGVKLNPAYSGTGFNDSTRVFSDFAARLYFMEESER